MIHLPRALILALALGAILPAADSGSQAVAAFKEAFATQDASAKKAALRALASGGNNSEIIPLLIAQVEDRQVSDAVMATLRSRTGTGLSMDAAANGSAANPKRPGEWQAWFRAWQEQEKSKQDVAKLQAKVDSRDPSRKTTPQPPAAAPVSSEPTAHRAAPDDLGKPVRIFFHGGASKLYHVISRRIDADGNLVSLRVAHPDGGGEETLAADIIARIQEGAD